MNAPMESFRLPSATPVRGLLRCLDAGFFIPTFEEEGYSTVGILREDGEETVRDFVSALGMPRGSDERLLTLTFSGVARAAADDDGAASSAEAASCDPGVARSSRAFDAAWLDAVAPLYERKMGCENMGPLLYSLARFLKPSRCLEIGAGYTTAFLMQALEDNARELETWQRWDPPANQLSKDSWLVSGAINQCVDAGVGDGSHGVLHCVDNFAHASSTAPQLLEVAAQLGIAHRLSLHLDDARAFLEESTGSIPEFDFVWLDGLLDFARPVAGDVGRGIDEFLSLVWPRVSPGGFVLLHSTITNSAVRAWLDGVQGAVWGPPGAVMSLLEPHKRFQNSVTLLQRRPEGWGEPIYSKLP